MATVYLMIFDIYFLGITIVFADQLQPLWGRVLYTRAIKQRQLVG